MKGLAVLISSIGLAANAFCFPFHHQQHNNLSSSVKAVKSFKKADFSGVWSGYCFDEEIKLSISQNDSQITLSYFDLFSTSNTFTFDELTFNNSSANNRSSSSMQHANFQDANNLTLVLQEMGLHSNRYVDYGSMNIRLTKEDDSLKVTDIEDETSCVLTKE